MGRSPLPVGAHALAAAQARAHASFALATSPHPEPDPQPGAKLARLVNGALAMELYFKALMIAGRRGTVSEGHDLVFLLDQFPRFLRQSFSSIYDQQLGTEVGPLEAIALRISPNAPATPNGGPDDSYGSFDDAISSFAHVFVKARYFFEELAAPDWVFFSYSPWAMRAALNAQEQTYVAFVNGAFRHET